MSTSAALLRAVAFQLAERAGGRGVAVQIDRLWRVLVVIDRFVVSGWHTTIKFNSIDAIVLSSTRVPSFAANDGCASPAFGS
jgi:hypothetical protein